MEGKEGQVYDLEADKWIGAPAAKDDGKGADKPAETKKEDEPEDEPEEDKKDPELEEEDKKDPEEEKKEPEPEDEDEDEPEDKKDAPEQKPEDVDALISAQYSEEYDIKSKAELDEILESVDQLADANEALTKELEDLKKSAGTPKFESEAQQKAFDFLHKTGYDPERFADGIMTHAELVAMDIDKTDEKILMEKAYLIRHPELDRQEAQRKFERQYSKKYMVSKEDFDDDKKFEDAKDDAQSEKKIDLKRDRDFLKTQQQEFKAKPADKTEDKSVLLEVVQHSIEKHARQVDQYTEKWNEIIFAPTDQDEDNFPVKFTGDKLKAIQDVVKHWVRNPASYKKSGELITGNLDPEKLMRRAAFSLFGEEEIVPKLWEHANQVFSTKRAEDIGKVKPDRKAKIGEASVKDLSEDAQWNLIAKNRGKKVA